MPEYLLQFAALAIVSNTIPANPEQHGKTTFPPLCNLHCCHSTLRQKPDPTSCQQSMYILGRVVLATWRGFAQGSLVRHLTLIRSGPLKLDNGPLKLERILLFFVQHRWRSIIFNPRHFAPPFLPFCKFPHMGEFLHSPDALARTCRVCCLSLAFTAPESHADDKCRCHEASLKASILQQIGMQGTAKIGLHMASGMLTRHGPRGIFVCCQLRQCGFVGRAEHPGASTGDQRLPAEASPLCHNVQPLVESLVFPHGIFLGLLPQRARQRQPSQGNDRCAGSLQAVEQL